MQYTYEYNGQTVTLTLERQPDGMFTANIGGRKYVFTASPLPEGRWRIQMDNRHSIAAIESAGDVRYIQVDGGRYTLNVANAQTKHRRRGLSGGGDLSAQMPGQVREVRVSEGDSVKAGETLVVLEAMKMEIRVTAPADGTVKRLYVKTGDVVERGQRLVELSIS